MFGATLERYYIRTHLSAPELEAAVLSLALFSGGVDNPFNCIWRACVSVE